MGREGRRRTGAAAMILLLAGAASQPGAAQEGLVAGVENPDELRSAMQAAFRITSAKNVAALFSDEGVMLQGARVLVGPEEIRASLADMFADMEGANPLVFATDGVTKVPGMALDPGGFGPDGAESVGRYLLVSKLTDAGWRIVWMRWYR